MNIIELYTTHKTTTTSKFNMSRHPNTLSAILDKVDNVIIKVGDKDTINKLIDNMQYIDKKYIETSNIIYK